MYSALDVQLCLFGYVLFEMATGFECPTPSPLDCFHEIPRKNELDKNIKVLLGTMFGDRSMGNAPTIEGLLEDPFFNAINVPRSDISGFVALKEENDNVHRMVAAAKRQMRDRYSAETLLGEHAVGKRQTAGTLRKKKKKRKRKRDGMGGVDGVSVPSSVSSPVPASAGVLSQSEDASNVVSPIERLQDSEDDLWSSL